MRSSVYQMSSTVPHLAPGAVDPQTIDPENRLLWRAHLQRLEAEQIHDALLMAGGVLDRTMGGKTLALRNREFVFNHTSKNETTYHSTRRALYLPVIRNHLYDLFEQFDYPDPTMPTGSRNSTVVAPQALMLLNSPLVMQTAEQLAARLCSDPRAAGQRVERAYAILFSRAPTASERVRALNFVKANPDSRDRWMLLCHALLAANEFVYLR
jgi:hypothetical protein